MKYPKKITGKISNETYKQFHEIKSEIKKKKNIKISYRTAIEFFVDCYFNPDSTNGMKLKKFLHEDKIKNLENEIKNLESDLIKEKSEYETLLHNLKNSDASFNINNYNKKTIEIATTYIDQYDIKNIDGIEDHETFNHKLISTGLKGNEFKDLLNYLINE